MVPKITDHKGNPVEHGRQLLSNGVQIHYYTAGSGPAVLLEHGIPKTSYYWRKVLPHLTPWYTVVVPDLRGFGDSSHPQTGYDMGTVADDLAELMTCLSHDKFHMIGEDWGAAAGYQVAVRHPQRVRSLIFQEMMLPGFGFEEWAKPHHHNGPHLWQVAFYNVPDVPEFLLAGREKEFLEWFLKRAALDPSSIDDDAVAEYVSKFAQPGGIRSLCSFFREPESLRLNREAAENRLTLPVLAIGGAAFLGKEVQRQMERVAENVVYTEFKYGHHLAEECPDILGKRYLSFLRSV